MRISRKKEPMRSSRRKKTVAAIALDSSLQARTSQKLRKAVQPNLSDRSLLGCAQTRKRPRLLLTIFRAPSIGVCFNLYVHTQTGTLQLYDTSTLAENTRTLVALQKQIRICRRVAEHTPANRCYASKPQRQNHIMTQLFAMHTGICHESQSSESFRPAKQPYRQAGVGLVDERLVERLSRAQVEDPNGVVRKQGSNLALVVARRAAGDGGELEPSDAPPVQRERAALA